jgi:hypothetical protein
MNVLGELNGRKSKATSSLVLEIAFVVVVLFYMTWVPALAQKAENRKFDLKHYLDDPSWYPVKNCKSDSCWVKDSMQLHGIIPDMVDSSGWQWYQAQAFAWLLDPVTLKLFHEQVTCGYNLIFKKARQNYKSQQVRLYGDGLVMQGRFVVLDDQHFELRLRPGKWIKPYQKHWKNDESKAFDYVLYERKKGVEIGFLKKE